jgi:multidrug efflux pump subunit AcrA (membrane-fusion protein)
MMERPGSTRIISILPEGTWVKKDDVVCELDASAFNDELQLQRIRYAQAKAWVQQAKSLLEVAKISLREYKEGIYPQDAQLIQQYLDICRTEAGRAERNYVWSKETTAKGFRAVTQFKADELALQQARLRLHEADLMHERLEKFTKDKTIKELEAKVAAIRADELAQDQAFDVEEARLRKLEAMVEYCTMKAPGDGIVVYANQPNRMGQIENQITEGTAVRQGQPIFYLPDPNHMQVKAKVNESKVSLVQSGQRARIVVDAFPDRPMYGVVHEITPIPAPAAGPASDVRVYYAVVGIDEGGFAELRPGLSAEVTFLVDTKRDVTRVPVQAVRWFGNRSYVALPNPEATSGSGSGSGSRTSKESPWLWQEVVLGTSNTRYFEVVSGLTPGQKIIARPETLPTPSTAELRHDVAATPANPRG